MSDGPDPGWHSDPTGRHEYRYWDGTDWTHQVSDGGVIGSDPVDAEPDEASSGSNRTLLAVLVGLGVLALMVIGGVLLTRDGGGSGDDDALEAISSVSDARAAVAAAGIGCEPGGDGAASIEASAQFVRGALLAADAPDPVEPTDGFECETDAGRLAVYVFDEDADAAAYGELWSKSNQSCVVTVTGRNWFAVAIHNMNDGSPPAVADGDAVAEAIGGRVSERCGGGGEEPTDAEPDGDSAEAYPQAVIDNYMTSCTAQGAPAANCQCTIDHIQQNLTLQEFADLEQQSVATGVIAPEFQAALDACQ